MENNVEYILTEINIYPVKSLGGISLHEAEVTDRGLKYDRRWMLVDENGKFLTQRVLPQMSLIKTSIDNHSLKLYHKLKDELSFSVPLEIYNDKQHKVAVWNDAVDAIYVSKEADQWFSETLEFKCNLVYMPATSKRRIDTKYAKKNEIVSFADAFPFLIIGQSSLDDLNSRLDEKLPMNRFRPNFVFEGGAPFDEDKMKSFKLGNIIFYPVKPCSRCVVTTINQDTGTKGKEPLATLANYRTHNNKVMFGQNLLHEGRGTVKVGSRFEEIEWK